ncbi:hypothetical protein HDV01_006103 [Terramyces sp. JEL0728]|nr:hypothetical protein HDV01_006103 [Terramyces sp. JEL0728]
MPVRGIRSDKIKKKDGILDYEAILEELTSRHWPLLNGFPHQKKDFGPAAEANDWDSDEDKPSKPTTLNKPSTTAETLLKNEKSNAAKSEIVQPTTSIKPSDNSRVSKDKTDLDDIDALLDSLDDTKSKDISAKTAVGVKLEERPVTTALKEPHLTIRGFDSEKSSDLEKDKKGKPEESKPNTSSVPVSSGLSSLSGLPSLSGPHLSNLPALHGLNKVLAPLSKDKELSPKNNTDKSHGLNDKHSVSPRVSVEKKPEATSHDSSKAIPSGDNHTKTVALTANISVGQPNAHRFENKLAVEPPISKPQTAEAKRGGLGSEIVDDISDDIEEDIAINSDEDEEFSKLKVKPISIKKVEHPTTANSTSILPVSPLSPPLHKNINVGISIPGFKPLPNESATGPVSPISPLSKDDKNKTLTDQKKQPKPFDINAKKDSNKTLLGNLPNFKDNSLMKKQVKKESNYEDDFGAGDTDSEIVFSDDGLPIDDANDSF